MARIGQKAMELAREKGIKVGILRPITLWPFPSKAIAAYADKVKGMLVTELNAGQMIEDVRLAVNGKVKVEHFGRLGGIVPDPDEIVNCSGRKNNQINETTMNPDKIRNVLNILFMILALAAIIVYFVVGKEDFKMFIYVCGAAIFVKLMEIFYTVHQQIRRRSYD